MKITLWQQFSSNHSASYTVVGKFQTEAAAQDALDALGEILMELIVEYGEPKDSSRLRGEHIGERFGFEWQEEIDWLHSFYYKREDPRKTIWRFENWLIVGPVGFMIKTWQTGHQFEKLLKAFGAESFHDSAFAYTPDDDSDTARIHFSLDCKAPSSEIATDILHALQEHLRDQHHIWDWLPFHPEWDKLTKDLSLEEFREQERFFLQELEAWITYSKQFEELKKESWQAWAKKIREESSQFFTQPEQVRDMIWRMRYETGLRSYSNSISLELNQETINLKDTHIHNMPIFLRAITPWLKSKNCQVTCNFQPV